MIELKIPNKDILMKNYVADFKYGGLNMVNNDQETLRNIKKIGEKLEIIVNLPFLELTIKTKCRVAFISKSSIIFSFENTTESEKLKEKIEEVIGDQRNENIFK